MHMQYILAEWPETSSDSPGGRAVHPGKQTWLPVGSSRSGPTHRAPGLVGLRWDRNLGF